GERNSYSKTDVDATFMRLKDDHMQNGQLKPAYNTQISTEEQFITHYSIHQSAGDTTTLKDHLEGFEENYGSQSDVVVADAGYGKYNYFPKEQKRAQKNNPFLLQNLYYNKEEDFYVCPMGQKMAFAGKGKRVSTNGYVSSVSYYQAGRCEGCPMRGQCHKAKG